MVSHDMMPSVLPHVQRHSHRIESYAQAAGNRVNTHNLFGLSLSQTEHTIRATCPGKHVTCVGEAMHKGIPVESCSGSGKKYTNLFGASFSTAERLGLYNALGVWEDMESQSHISLDRDFRLTRLPNRCFPSVASVWHAADSQMCL